jgi:toxin CptA
MIEILTIAILTTSMIFYVWRIALLRSSRSIVAIEIGIDGKCAFQTRNGRWHTAKLRGTSFASPSLTILNLQPHDGRYTRNVVIVPDNAESEEFRQLRIWLRWKR